MRFLFLSLNSVLCFLFLTRLYFFIWNNYPKRNLLQRTIIQLQDTNEYLTNNSTNEFAVFNKVKNYTISEEDITKGRPREAYRNISYNSIDVNKLQKNFSKKNELKYA